MVRFAVSFAFIILASVASGVTPEVITTHSALFSIDFSNERVVFVGETDHYDKTLLATELRILGAIDASNKAPRKCLILEAESLFDEAFKILSKSIAPHALKRANMILDSHGLMTDSISWIGETYPLEQFEFAVSHGWTVRSGDMLRDRNDIAKVRSEPANDELRSYHILYQRNQFLAERIIDLLKTDCDLAVVLWGSAHFSSIEKLPTFNVHLTPVPTLLERKSISSKTIFAANLKVLKWAEWMTSVPNERYRPPEAVVAFP